MRHALTPMLKHIPQSTAHKNPGPRPGGRRSNLFRSASLHSTIFPIIKPAVCYTVGNPAYYAHPGPFNLHDKRSQAAVQRRPLLSLPLAAGLPPLKNEKDGFALSASLRYALVANPSFNGSKGEGQPPPRGRGPKGKKNANVHVCVFFLTVGFLPPRRCTAAAGRTPPARSLGFPSQTA
jgi:hypothetical protein